MSKDVPPPSHTNVQVPSSRNPFPERFTIGRRKVDILVKPEQLRGHLSILHAFHSLRSTVESDDHSRFPDDVRLMEPEQRWGWFVSIAVERFDRWYRSLGDWCSTNIELALPPTDVLMIWHAYLLNPIWYAEDMGRALELFHLPVLSEYLATNIASPDLFITNSPHPDRVHNWEHHTGTPYDPLDAAASLSNKEVKCPWCEQRTAVPFIGLSGSGYAQSNFAASCSSCGKTIKKSILGLYKFASDISRTNGFLAGTLHTTFYRRDIARATLVKKRVMRAAGLPLKTYTAKEVMQKLNFDPALLSKILGQIQSKMGKRIQSAYTDDRLFSTELVGAVLRQALFVRKMADLGWTDPVFFAKEDEMVVLQHCVARYHAFLGLMVDSPGSFFVPTLDIDLAWHTHQLMETRYHTDCKSVVGRYIDHDDKVEEDHLATSFDVTCRAWTGRYGLPYTHCGCPLPGTTLGQRLRHALSFHLHHKDESRRKELDALQPPAGAEGGTHASDHNAVYPIHDKRAADRARELRQQKAELRQQRAVSDANAKPRESAHAPAVLRPRSQTQIQTQMETHALPFFFPVPMWSRAAGCVGVPFVHRGACAVGIGGSCMAACAGPACMSVWQSGGSGGSSNWCGGSDWSEVGSILGGIGSILDGGSGGGGNCSGGGSCGGGCGGGD